MTRKELQLALAACQKDCTLSGFEQTNSRCRYGDSLETCRIVKALKETEDIIIPWEYID